MLQRSLLRQSHNVFAPLNPCLFCEARTFLGHLPRRRYARPAPSTRRMERRAKDYVLTPTEMAQRQQVKEPSTLPLPREDLLEAAQAAGFLEMTKERALGFLEEFGAMGKSVSVRKMRELCEDYDLSLPSLVPLSRILLRSTSPAQRITGKRLLFALSAAGSPPATLRLMDTALKTEQLTSPELVPVRAHFMSLVNKDKHPLAMVLYAQILQREGELKRALPLLEEATARLAKGGEGVGEDVKAEMGAAKPDQQALDIGTEGPSVTPPWTALGTLRLRLRDAAGAKQAFEIGALQGDDPMAYFYLAEFEGKHSAKWLLYMTKAAASGHVTAAYNLGLFYSLPLEEAEKLQDEEVKKEFFKVSTYAGDGKERVAWAAHWFGVATMAYHFPAALALAKLRWQMCAYGSAMERLDYIEYDAREGARKSRKAAPEVVAEARALREEWTAWMRANPELSRPLPVWKILLKPGVIRYIFQDVLARLGDRIRHYRAEGARTRREAAEKKH